MRGAHTAGLEAEVMFRLPDVSVKGLPFLNCRVYLHTAYCSVLRSLTDTRECRWDVLLRHLIRVCPHRPGPTWRPNHKDCKLFPQ